MLDLATLGVVARVARSSYQLSYLGIAVMGKKGRTYLAPRFDGGACGGWGVTCPVGLHLEIYAQNSVGGVLRVRAAVA